MDKAHIQLMTAISGSTILKLFLTAGYFYILIQGRREEVVFMVLSFFAFYILFTLFELIQLITNLRPILKGKTTRDDN